jgi:Type VI secretion system/phage-baseplate injector OB domain
MEGREVMCEMLEVMEGSFFGKYRGIVRDNNDPTGRGRLEVLVPAVMGDEPVWALPCAPYAGNNMGLYAIPEKGTGVWVEFEAGDPSYPIWVGCFWADGQAPKNERGAEAAPPLKIIRSQKGLLVTLDDKQQVITLSDKDGNNLVTIEVQQGKVTVKGAQKVVVEAPQIELVENATHPVVFGDQLLQYLNQLVQLYQIHTHPGETVIGIPVSPAPPMPPFQPATPDLISTRVKSG